MRISYLNTLFFANKSAFYTLEALQHTVCAKKPLPGFFLTREIRQCLFSFAVCCAGVLAINQFNISHRRIVTNAETHFQDTRVATRTGVEMGA